jgi:hypothetical protein
MQFNGLQAKWGQRLRLQILIVALEKEKFTNAPNFSFNCEKYSAYFKL